MKPSLPQQPSFSLAGRRSVVTGAGRGIGLALATALARAGAEVTLVARTASEVEEGAAALRAYGYKAQSAQLDILDIAAVRTFFDTQQAFHVLVNNAGTNRPMPMQSAEPEDYDAVMGLNSRAAFFVAQACARKMIEAGETGSLIHIGSQMGHVGGANRALYCASKWALEGMSKAFALDLASHGIRSNTIAPTFIETPMTKPYFEDADFREEVLRKIKLGRLGRVEDLMGAVVFLTSDAASLMTGSSIVIDGGWTAD
ncbi:SDR family oxidoreductase [Parasphingopyxis algicola]|uniref:SDR family NAD(P)-dependent oxidoreductase n=1 Tax=Parasphingopyxis algicola TaxID=2026624 RepID=UPI00159FDEF5|nr:SDR family oxidoreductase [Parasphingopyxis algicola]QLC26385.1 SDR family oxidoreductase [Parasphingopyxis algicola]